ncbi:MAG: hypothetical protein ACXABK_00855 [Candidatus Heimdallarchaeaceae archaeon]
MSDFDLPWEKFVGFSLFTLEEDMVFDKVINQKTPFSTVFQVVDTSVKIREELKKSQTITLINEVFRVDYNLFYNIILCCMFLPDADEQASIRIIEIIKQKLVEQLQDYGAINKMEPRSQTALIKKLGNLISERAASQIRYDFFPTKKTQQIDAEPVVSVSEEPVSPVTPEKPDRTFDETPTAPISTPSTTPSYSTQTTTSTQPTQQLGQVEGLLDFIGFKKDKQEEVVDEKRVQLTQQLLEETKRLSIERVLSSVIKGLSAKTGVCFVYTGDKGDLETLTYGMTEKHAEFVLGILSKYPEVIKQTLSAETEEKTLDAGDGVVILEEAETGMLVSITKNREEIPIISKRLKVVKTMMDEFLKSSF